MISEVILSLLPLQEYRDFPFVVLDSHVLNDELMLSLLFVVLVFSPLNSNQFLPYGNTQLPE